MAIPKVLILRSPGSNCDGELHFAFEKAGAIVERVHVQRLREHPSLLKHFQILAIPGGFSYGDDVAAGKILAVQLAHFLSDALRQFRDSENLVLGVCNGFQVLLKAGLLIPPDEDDGPLATLALNSSGRFGDRWIHLKTTSDKCPFLKDIDNMLVPVAHGEGRFVCRKDWILKGLEQAGQVVLKYCGLPIADCGLESKEPVAAGNANQPAAHFATRTNSAVLSVQSEIRNPQSAIEILPFPINPNGSQADVAGLCDPTGRVLGLMPHPERHVLPTQHPQWTRRGLAEEGDGLKLFKNAVQFFA
jgi:phosphoribosylformylglycinamidine synthase